MFEREERLLKQMGREAEEQAGAVSDAALNAAVQSGIRKARHLRAQRRRSTIALMGALALILLIILWGGKSPVPQREQLAQGPYRSISGFDFGEDITINTANIHGLIQPVNQSASQGEYKATINGVLVGSQQLRIFYTLENLSDAPVKLMRAEAKRKGSDIALDHFSVLSHMPNPVQNMQRSWLEIRLKDESRLTDEITISFVVAPYSTNIAHAAESEDEVSLSIDVTLDLETSRKYTTIIALNKMLEIEHQRYYLEQAILSPGGIVVKASVPDSNTMKVTGLMEPYVESVVDGEVIRLAGRGAFLPGEDGRMTYFFDSNLLDRPESLILKASGLLAVDSSAMQVVVDTEKGEVIDSPDGGIHFGSYEENVLILEYREEVGKHFGSVSFKPDFVDGEGRRHTVNEEPGVRTSSSSDDMDTGVRLIKEYIYLKPEDYPQPLTFELSSYPGAVEQVLEIPLK